MGKVLVAGTLDTKAEELKFLAHLLSGQIDSVLIADLSTRSHNETADITAETIASFHPDGAASVVGAKDRGTAIAAMQIAFERYCALNAASIDGIIGAGGGGGTSMITAGMRQLSYGIPKVMVSTLASGDVSPYLDVSDIVMIPSITDIAGLNRLSRVILTNAANALAGMCLGKSAPAEDIKPAIGLTMFGVTTAAVTQITEALRPEADCLVFHATGAGGRAMERLASEGILSSILDITTTEICDLLIGGVLPADPSRLDVIARSGMPYIGSVGALDMVNFWAPDTVPDNFRGRRFYQHNSNVTLMRTTPGECARIGEWIGAKLNACEGPVRFLIPEMGVSALDIDGGPFRDQAADAALFTALSDTIRETDNRRVQRLTCHINDPEFADSAVAAYREIHRS